VAKKPGLIAQRNVRPINGCLGWGIAFVAALGVVDSRRVMPSLAFIIAVYAIGLVTAAVAWYRDFRWKTEFYTIGMSALIYSTAVLLLAGQFLLALGAFVFVLVILIYPPIARQTHEAVRNRRRHRL
jgi:CHASE2 domain-containing sensor protein